MCELFGLSANYVVSVEFVWRGFVERGRSNPDGWGVAWFLDGCLGLVKEPRPAHRSSIAKLLMNGIRGSVVISHVRRSTRGEPSYVNTHPFVRRLRGREWVFAHNGDVSEIVGAPGFELRRFFPVGETDSEYTFCYLMDRLYRLGEGVESVLKVSKAVWEVAREILSQSGGKLNFLLSNGECLFAYMSQPNTLHYLLRHPPHRGWVKLLDQDFEVRLEEAKASSELAAIVATNPLTDEEWRAFEPNQLYVFHRGDLLLKVDEGGEPKAAISDVEARVLACVRTSLHSIALKDIAQSLELTFEETQKVVEKLVAKGFLKQHFKDAAPPNSPRARYHTQPQMREIIDKLIIKNRE